MSSKKVKILKCMLVIFLAIILVYGFVMNVNALSPKQYEDHKHTVNTGEIESIGQRIFRLVIVTGTFVSVIALVIMGIKYMIGSAEEKSEYKKTMLPYLIGAFFLFAASALAQILYNVFSSFTGV